MLLTLGVESLKRKQSWIDMSLETRFFSKEVLPSLTLTLLGICVTDKSRTFPRLMFLALLFSCNLVGAESWE